MGLEHTSVFLQIMQTVEGEIVLLNDELYQMDNVFRWENKGIPYVKLLPADIHSFLMWDVCIQGGGIKCNQQTFRW